MINHQNKTADNRRLIAEEDGIRYITEAMKLHSGNEEVQNSACGVLRNLALNDQNKVIIADAGGIKFIIEAMKNHELAAAVQEVACGALWNLSVNGHFFFFLYF
eukprot:TRINITY_DN10656_c0_g1_i1.p1 TRINITY_DN10656_c0_g1~~TRINITY_DN10656_c0_g1_i1.p1  ORF type:complete len:112 (-),score=19.81 TRINITY_DN10656_c0_g1_i1:198-509(-)